MEKTPNKGKVWFEVSKMPVTFDGTSAIMADSSIIRFFIKVMSPAGLRDLLISTDADLGFPTEDDFKIAEWMCNALNHARQRTDEALRDLNLDGGKN